MSDAIAYLGAGKSFQLSGASSKSAHPAAPLRSRLSKPAQRETRYKISTERATLRQKSGAVR